MSIKVNIPTCIASVLIIDTRKTISLFTWREMKIHLIISTTDFLTRGYLPGPVLVTFAPFPRGQQHTFEPPEAFDTFSCLLLSSVLCFDSTINSLMWRKQTQLTFQLCMKRGPPTLFLASWGWENDIIFKSCLVLILISTVLESGGIFVPCELTWSPYL